MKPSVYILFNRPYGVLYVGVTCNLKRRLYEHKIRQKGFSARYNVVKLAYCEEYQSIKDAIAREKQLKAGSRQQKIKLIESMNPNWRDLSEDLFLL